MRVLLISPPEPGTRYLHKALRESAHSVKGADNIPVGLCIAREEDFDVLLIVAGGARPSSTFITSIPELARLKGPPAIVVLLTTASAQERSALLRAGADACFVQPYSFMEIHERMLALFRTAPSHRPSGTGNVHTIDRMTQELVEGSKRLPLTKREYLVVECLLRSSGLPVGREQLLQYAWPENDDADPSIVNLFISRLRKKLAGYEFNASIQTISGFGYQWIPTSTK